MKRIIGLLLICVMILTMFTAFSSFKTTTASAESPRRELGVMRVSRFVTSSYGLWDKPYDNVLMLLTSGQTVNGYWYHRLYAKYDSSLGGYVVKAKESTLRTSLNHTLASDEIGICFNFSPLTNAGKTEALFNWKTWCLIRVGDLIKLSSDINLSARTADIAPVSAWGTSSFYSNAKLTVSTTRDPWSGTCYSDKTIVALGDSITSNGGWTEIIGDDLKCNIVNAGAGGDTAGNAISRFDRDVTPWNPDIVLIMFGVNDFLSTSNVTQGVTNYKNNLRTLYNRSVALGAKVMFMISNKNNFSSYESTYASQGGCTACFMRYYNAMKDLATETGSPFVDNYTPFDQQANYKDFLIDISHPNAKGFQLMINAIEAGLKDNCVYFTGMPLIVEMMLTQEAAQTCAMTNDGYLTGIKPGMTADQVKALFSTNVNVNGTKVATGTTVDGIDANGTVIKTVTIVIKGDINCDGAFDQTDMIKIKSIFLKTSTGDSAAALKAADVSGNGKINVTDYIAMKRHLLGTYNLYA